MIYRIGFKFPTYGKRYEDGTRYSNVEAGSEKAAIEVFKMRSFGMHLKIVSITLQEAIA